MKTYPHIIPVFERGSWTLPAVLSTRARTHSGKTFLRSPEEGFTATFDEMDRSARRVAASLLSHAKPGDRVVIMAANSAAFVQTWFGCAYAGMVDVPINTAYVGEFLEHQVGLAAPVVAVIDPSFADRFASCVAAKLTIRRMVLLGDPSEHAGATAVLRNAGFAVEPFTQLLEGSDREQLPEVHPSDPQSVLYTSGTTGLSKGVVLPHAQMHLFSELIAHSENMTDSDVYLAPVPLFHGNARFCATLPSLIHGAELVLRERFSATQWLDWIRDDRITLTNFIGVMMNFVWSQPRTPNDDDNQLRCILAVPTAASYAEEFKQRFGLEHLAEGYALTETGLMILTPYGAIRPAGAAGLLVDQFYDIRLSDPDTDEEVASGQPGEVTIRGKLPWIHLREYLGMPDKTAEAFRNLWLHTGDAVRRDHDGWYYFVDRYKDALRRRGENISSFEIEQPISMHPAVAACAVVGIPSDIEGGEDEVLAAVVPRAGENVTAEEIWAWCEGRIPVFAVPRYIQIVESLPTTPTDKVRKAEIRAAGVDTRTADRFRSPSSNPPPDSNLG